MQSIKNQKKHTRALSLFLVFVLFTQDLLAFQYACNVLSKPLSSSNKSVVRSVDSASTQPVKMDVVKKGKSLTKVQRAPKPAQAETSGFSIGSTDGMVNKFTGDFSYSIPLGDVEGYPMVLQYSSSNITMNTESSWVGLGWNFNVGDVSREMRGLPDEFNGEQTVNRTFKQVDDGTVGTKKGVYVGGGLVLGGFFMPSGDISLMKGRYLNTYILQASTYDLNLGAGVSMGSSSHNLGLDAGIGYSYDSKRGIGTNKSFGFSATFGDFGDAHFTFGNNFHTRAGLTEKTRDLGLTVGSIGSYGASSYVPYGTRTSVPSVKLNSSGVSFNLSYDRFNAVASASANVGYQFRLGTRRAAYFNYNAVSTNLDNQIIQPAIGYFHNGKREQFNENVTEKTTTTPLMDFNRSNDFEFSEQMSNLAFSFQTYDVFVVNALGNGETFRAKRDDIGTYYDPTSKSENTGAGLNVGYGNIAASTGAKVQISANVPVNKGGITSENFKNGDNNVLEFNSESKGDLFDQAIYFKGVGEMTPEAQNDLNTLGGVDPSRIYVTKSTDGKSVALESKLVQTSGTTYTINNASINQPETRYSASYFKPYTATEYTAIESNYLSQNLNVFGPSMQSSISSIPRINSASSSNKNLARASNHLSVIETVSTDGMRYTFGIPAYEVLSSQVTFCAKGMTETNGLTSYSTGDNTVNNNRGVSHYFDKTDVPSYPHSFLLTEMVSSDYVDRLGDGLTMDDMGSYYKFNHTRLYSDTDPYKWKFPMGVNQAMLAKNNLGTDEDDLANYTYGEKEIWYTHSVESKNMIAEFTVSNRYDGHGVVDENGAINTAKPLKKLDKITIYNRSERLGANGANAKPLQTIEFEYSYELCKNHPSNEKTIAGQTISNSGKLTLKAVRSYGGVSREMGIYSYEFTYDSYNNQNFTYSNVDEWGNYRAQIGTKPNDLFPYATQTLVDANNNSKAWKLIKIKNPMGGTIEVDYESDSYATVQDNRAMKHIDVYKMTNLIDFLEIQSNSTWDGSSAYASNNFNTDYGSEQTLENSLSSWTNFDDFKDLFLTKGKKNGTYKNTFGALDLEMIPNNVVIFPLDTPIASSTDKTTASILVKDKYFTNESLKYGKKEIKEVYFKLLVNAQTEIEEMIPTFGNIMLNNQTDVFHNTLPVSDDFLSIGVMPAYGGNYNYGYVVLDPANESKKKDKGNDNDVDGQIQINPLQKSALEYIRRNLPDKVYGTCAMCIGNPLLDFAVLFGGNINLSMDKLGWAQSFKANTTLRLFTQNDIKYGGNGRVKTITYKDAWDDISGEYVSSYQWSYKYSDDDVLTYGNAAFEPRQGIDESPLYKWDRYIEIHKKFPDETKFTPTPIAVDLFPAPVIGYEKVFVIFNSATVNGLSSSDFYTSRQYPFTETPSPLDKSTHIDDPSNLLTGRTTDLYGYSQGFLIETNDYHGKPKEMLLYKIDENNEIHKQSRTTYHYANLGETVKMIDRNKTITSENVAQEIDIHADSRKVDNFFKHQTFGLSVTVTIMPFFLLPMPMYMRTERIQQFNSHALIKHINRSAIVESIETEYLGSINTAQNMLYDKYTGNVILSSLQDEYDDNLYSLSYPAHWYYKELREISGVENTIITSTVTTDGSLTSTGIDNSLTPGDQVKLMNVSGTPTVWVAKVYPWPLAGGGLYLMNDNGTAYTGLTGSHQLKIVKTNRDNRLGETMQSVVTKKDPLTITGTVPNEVTTITFPTTEVIETGAITYKDKNYYKCNYDPEKPARYNEVVIGSTVNPYKFGTRGDLVMDGQYSWQGERSNETHAYKTRFDGAYLGTIAPMYTWNNNAWEQINTVNHANWRKMGEVTTFNQFGKPVESRDQIKVYSSVVYGYNNNYELVPVAQAVNAKEQEIAFDGFEDYAYLANEAVINVSDSHFDYKTALNTNITLETSVRHSGLKSLKVAANNTASVQKKIQSSATCIAADVPDPSNKNVTIDACNCVKPFEPTPGTYIVGAWIRNTDPLTASPARVRVAITGGNTLTFAPSGPVIDGWQRLEGEFNIPSSGATIISVDLVNTSSQTAVYFDDLRIHPLLAGMTTVVYDPATLLPMATHDGYNFTTFYNYDENLNQVRLRVETVEGIKTVSETESGGFKSPKQ